MSLYPNLCLFYSCFLPWTHAPTRYFSLNFPLITLYTLGRGSGRGTSGLSSLNPKDLWWIIPLTCPSKLWVGMTPSLSPREILIELRETGKQHPPHHDTAIPMSLSYDESIKKNQCSRLVLVANSIQPCLQPGSMLVATV